MFHVEHKKESEVKIMPKTTKTLTSAERGVNLFNDARRNSSNEYMRATGEVTVATSITRHS